MVMESKGDQLTARQLIEKLVVQLNVIAVGMEELKAKQEALGEQQEEIIEKLCNLSSGGEGYSYDA